MYKLNVNISQLIYDGGATKQLKEVGKIKGELDKQGVRIELYRLKKQVQELYFRVLLSQQSNRLLEVLKGELEEKHKTVLAAVDNGVSLSSNADIIKAEIIHLEQNILKKV